MLEDHALITRIASKFHIIVTVLVAMLGAAFLGISAGEGDFFGIYVSIFAASFIAVILALGDKYWMVIVFAFTTRLPAIPIKQRMLELPEIAAVLCSAVFLIRYAVKRQQFGIFRKEHAPFLLYTGWVIFIFIQNPVGLADAGAALGGARFYAKILLALSAFLIVANQAIDEKDCKWIWTIMLVGAIFESAYQIGMFFLPLGLIGLEGAVQLQDPDAFYSWHQALAQLPILLLMLGFARYKSGEIFSFRRLWIPVLFCLCVIVIAMSGKRAALASVPLFAITVACVRKEWGFLALWIAGAIMAAGIVVIGHGELFRLPLTIQRAFSVLPAKWDSELDSMSGGQDEFRIELRRQAMLKIEKDPWIGTGYQVNLSLSQALLAQYSTRGGDTELQVAPFAMGSAWHNTWLGYAADFGIPASILVGVIYFSVIRKAWKWQKAMPANSMIRMTTLYILLFTVRDVVFSHTGGHSAEDAFSRWWMYGLLTALVLTHNRKPENRAEANVMSGGQTLRKGSAPHFPDRRPARVARPVAI